MGSGAETELKRGGPELCCAVGLRWRLCSDQEMRGAQKNSEGIFCVFFKKKRKKKRHIYSASFLCYSSAIDSTGGANKSEASRKASLKGMLPRHRKLKEPGIQWVTMSPAGQRGSAPRCRPPAQRRLG